MEKNIKMLEDLRKDVWATVPVYNDVVDSIKKTEMEIMKSKDELMMRVRKEFKELFFLMKEGGVSRIKTRTASYCIDCGTNLMKYNTEVHLISNVTNYYTGILMKLNCGYQNVFFNGIPLYADANNTERAIMDMLIENWDNIFEELIKDYRNEFNKKLEKVHKEYEKVSAISDKFCN